VARAGAQAAAADWIWPGVWIRMLAGEIDEECSGGGGV
jgi:hypothetical protein